MAGGKIKKKIAALMLAPLLAAGAAAPSSAAMTLPGSELDAVAALAGRTLSPLASRDGVARLAAAAVDSLQFMLTNSSTRIAAALAQAEPAGRPATAEASSPAPADSGASSPAALGSASFGSVAIPFKRLSAVKKLAPALEEMQAEASLACGGDCPGAVLTIAKVVRDSDGASLRDKLNRVNSAVNAAIRYRPDIETYNVSDRWATPSETLARQEGDCEDYAILKMAALRAGALRRLVPYSP